MGRHHGPGSPGLILAPGASLERIAQALVLAHRDLPDAWKSRPLGLCLSGGADSCALVLAAAASRDRIPTEIVGLHARHGLRGADSEADARSVRELCARCGFPLIEVDASVEPGPDLEARAREIRYHALRQAFPGLLATAHHATDQAETVVLRLLRGAGPLGLRAIRRLRDDGVWRPFLDLPGTLLKDACRDAAWLPRHDASNDDERHARNWVRHRWLPAQEAGVEVALLRLAESAEALSPLLERRLSELSEQAGLRCEAGGFRLDLSPWREVELPEPELDLLLERAWTRVGRRPWAPEQRHRLVRDAGSGHRGRRLGGQGEIALWGGRLLQVRRKE